MDTRNNTLEDPASVIAHLRARVATLEAQVARSRQSERALRDSEQRFRTICENAPIMIDSFDDHGRCVFWNRECEDALGWTHDDMTASKDPLGLCYPDSSTRNRALESIQLADGEFREFNVRAKDGSTRIQLWANFRLSSGAVISVGHDVTDRRAMEDQLRHRQKMEALGQLTGGIAHDFNNLLTVILTCSELARRRANRGNQSSTVPLVTEIERAAQRGSALVGKLMAFSRLERLSLVRVDLVALARELTPTLRRLLPDSIHVECTSEGPVESATADPLVVEQMIVNLATNARDAMPSGGTLSLHVYATDVHPETGKRGPFIGFRVGDTGMGIDGNTRPHVFEPFFTTKPRGAGTGMGLPSVYGHMQQHAGSVVLDSQPGRGTQVTLLFPATSAAANDAVGKLARYATDTTGLRGTERILLAEDDGLIRATARDVLEEFGYEVLIAMDGAHALQILSDESCEAIDLVISDVVMPNLSGPELFRASGELHHTPRFLLTSGHTAGGLGDILADKPDVPFFFKPWSASQLLAKVREVLDLPGKR